VKSLRIKQGDSICSVAFKHGFYWETLWKHPDNIELADERKDQNILQEGDVVAIPDLSPKQESCGTDSRHVFRRRGVPVKLRLRLLETAEMDDVDDDDIDSDTCEWDEDSSSEAMRNQTPMNQPQPRPDVEYMLDVENGPTIWGTTAADGLIEIAVPPDARKASLVLNPGADNEETIELRIGYLNPVNDVSGAQARLNNIGFRCGRVDGDAGAKTEHAIRNFQHSAGLGESGKFDEPTMQELAKYHEST